MTHGGFISAHIDDPVTGRKKLVLLCQPLVSAQLRGALNDTQANADAMRATLEALQRGEVVEAVQGFCGACFETPEAARVREKLDEALAELPHATAGVLHHAMTRDELDLGHDLYLRRVCAWGVAGVEADTWPAGAEPFEMDDPDESPTTMLLTNRFELPVERSGGLDPRRSGGTLTIQTLAVYADTCAETGASLPPDALSMRTVFGDTDLTLQRGGFATSVRLDGRVLRADEAAALRLRSIIRARISAQLLLSLRDCVQHRWAGGFLALRRAAVPLLGADSASWLEPLAQQLLRVRIRTVNRLLLQLHIHPVALSASRTWEAEAYEACGDFASAARIYKSSCEEDEVQLAGYFRCGARHAAVMRPMGWVRCGKSFIAAKRYAEAEAALQAGLRSLDGLLTDEDRESVRIELLHGMLDLYEKTGERIKESATCTSLFAAQIPLVKASEVAAGAQPPGFVNLRYDKAANNYMCVGPRSGRRFMVVQRQGDHYGVPVASAVMHYIIEVPPGQAPPAAHPDAFLDRTEIYRRMNAEHHALPVVPKAVCAQCAAPVERLQRCAACMTAAYCSKACQLAHWPAHKAACKAARAAKKTAGAASSSA